MRTFPSISLALVLSLSACGKKEEGKKAESKASGPKTTYGCTVQIARKPAVAEVEGRGDGPDEATATAKAWDDVCAKLPEAERPSCKDTSKWSPGIATMKVNAGAGDSYGVTIKLSAVTETVTGGAKSDVDEATACKLAREDACKKAGAQGDCVASGAFEEKGKGTSKETSSM